MSLCGKMDWKPLQRMVGIAFQNHCPLTFSTQQLPTGHWSKKSEANRRLISIPQREMSKKCWLSVLYFSSFDPFQASWESLPSKKSSFSFRPRWMSHRPLLSTQERIWVRGLGKLQRFSMLRGQRLKSWAAAYSRLMCLRKDFTERWSTCCWFLPSLPVPRHAPSSTMGSIHQK